jgi:hypothetical protein
MDLNTPFEGPIRRDRRPIRNEFTGRLRDSHGIAPTGYRLDFEPRSAISTAAKTGKGRRLKSAMRINSDMLVSFG